MDTDKRKAMGGRYPLVSFRIRRTFPRPAAKLIKRYEKFFLCDISDKVGRMYTMDQTIQPFLRPALPLLGTAVTCKCPPGDNMGVKSALQMTEPGDVLVIDAQGFTEWCLGGFDMLALAIEERGLKGLVINGAYRDIAQTKAANFPIYCKGTAPFSGPKLGPFEINTPVCCGGVIVHPGDLVVASNDEGIVIVPQNYISPIADAIDEYGKHVKDKSWGVQREADRNEYFETLFEERGGIYLD
jgi:4-hydroxy-4-methyl-2-oxoglutarate aldolase